MPLAKLGPGRDTVPRVISTLGCALHLCQRFSKISQKTLTTLSPPGTLHPALCHLYCHPTQIRVHWLFVHHLKESRMGRVGGMSSTGCAAQIQKAWRHLAANNNDSWRNGKPTTPAAVGNLKQETSQGLLAIGHCGSTQLANLHRHCWQFSQWFCGALCTYSKNVFIKCQQMSVFLAICKMNCKAKLLLKE